MVGSPSPQDIFDVRKIRRLVELMNEHDLTEIDLRQGDTRIQLRRDPRGNVVVSGGGVPPGTQLSTSNSTNSTSPPVTPTPDEEAVEEHMAVITSPMVGTFYAAPDPNTPPYVSVGDMVSSDTTVCIIEAMKVFNEIPAGLSGKVVAVLVENGEPVEYGQPLYRVDTRQ